MEKLRQVQKYQFWILLFVALVLPLVGWFMSRSGLIADAAERTQVLQNLTTSLKADGGDPNGEWQRQLDVVNVEQQKQALIAWRALFDRQKPFMEWPQDMVDDPAKIEPFHQELYRERYVDELEKVHQIVNPADEKWKTGLVKFPEDLLPHPQEDWKFQAPSAKQIEAAQEDLWLLTALLKCIASVNEASGATTPFDAPIREITDFHLRGGTKGVGATSAPPAPGKPPGGGQGMPPGGMPPGGMPPGGMPPGGMPPGLNQPAAGRDAGSTGIANPGIKADEVLGPERPANDAASPAPPGGPNAPKGPPGPPGAPPGGPAKQGSVTGMDRYRDDQPEFKTRGFTLQVVMDLRSVPDLLVALSNCEGWPVNILRVHEADYKDEDLVVVDAGGGDGAQRPPAGNVRPPAGFGPPPRGDGHRPGEEAGNGPGGSRSPLDDPNLSRVAIVGLMYIFKTPPEAPAAPETPVVPAAAPVAGETATPPAAADSAPSDGDEPESEPAATDKPEATTEKDDSDEKGADASSDSSSDPATEAPEAKSKPKPAPKAKSGEP